MPQLEGMKSIFTHSAWFCLLINFSQHIFKQIKCVCVCKESMAEGQQLSQQTQRECLDWRHPTILPHTKPRCTHAAMPETLYLLIHTHTSHTGSVTHVADLSHTHVHPHKNRKAISYLQHVENLRTKGQS